MNTVILQQPSTLKKYIEELLEQYPNDLNKVSEILSISRRQLFNKLVEFGLK